MLYIVFDVVCLCNILIDIINFVKMIGIYYNSKLFLS